MQTTRRRTESGTTSSSLSTTWRRTPSGTVPLTVPSGPIHTKRQYVRQGPFTPSISASVCQGPFTSSISVSVTAHSHQVSACPSRPIHTKGLVCPSGPIHTQVSACNWNSKDPSPQASMESSLGKIEQVSVIIRG